MNFDVTSINITDWFCAVSISFLLIVILVLLAILSNKKKEFENEKSKILRETRVPLNKAIKLATYNVVNFFEMDDLKFEFERGKLFSDLEKDMSKMFREEEGSEEIFSKLYDIRDLYCKHRKIPADFFQKELEKISSFYDDAAFLIEGIKSSKKMGELFVEYSKTREQLLLTIERFSEEKNKKG